MSACCVTLVKKMLIYPMKTPLFLTSQALHPNTLIQTLTL